MTQDDECGSPRLRCGVCGEDVEFRDHDTSQVIGMMTDGRPLFSEEDHFPNLVDRCPGCGFCSFQITDGMGLSPDVLESDEYRAVLGRNRTYSPVEAYAYLLSHEGRHLESAYAYLNAVWMSDDESDEGESERLRNLVLSELRSYDGLGADDYVVAADLLRVLGRFEEARICADWVLGDPMAYDYHCVADKQLNLIGVHDRSHNVVFRQPMLYDGLRCTCIPQGSIDVVCDDPDDTMMLLDSDRLDRFRLGDLVAIGDDDVEPDYFQITESGLDEETCRIFLRLKRLNSKEYKAFW